MHKYVETHNKERTHNNEQFCAYQLFSLLRVSTVQHSTLLCFVSLQFSLLGSIAFIARMRPFHRRRSGAKCALLRAQTRRGRRRDGHGHLGMRLVAATTADQALQNRYTKGDTREKRMLREKVRDLITYNE